MVYKNPKFDLNKTPVDFGCNNEFNKDDPFDDTALRLECVGHDTISQQDAKSAPDDGCRLILGLGRTPGVCCNESNLTLKLSLSHGSSASKSGPSSFSNYQSSSCEISNGFGSHHVLDEDSTSVSGGYMPSLLLAPRISVPLQKLKISGPQSSVVSDFSRETASDPQTSSKKREFSGCANHQTGYCCGVQCSHSSGCSHAATEKSGAVAVCIRSNGTNSSVAHKGGKKHVVPGCTKSACGRTNCYVNHSGGKQYKFFAHDITHVCKAHGGSHGLVSDPGPGSPNNRSLSSSSALSNSTCWLGKPAKRRQLIPPQVLVPSSMKSSSFLPFTRQSSSGTDNNGAKKNLELVVPEGRVHGGSLLPFVSRDLWDAVIDEF
ncbi:hypothetical protein E3N88_06317 [Mikania micrantha]|uniref:Uncharacterized protein n=1 Tax=Mikania micrantha TaxID=192012 RepID=A0A5N6PP64_9ASTR|nr:hypothetical protein E3N88_06317 [Mikania micrantha]